MNVQMNVRIDDRVKRAGDRVFSGLGLTPSQVVRSVWEFAALHGEAPEAVRSALNSNASERNSLMREIEHDASTCARLRKQFGLPEPDRLNDLDYRELRERAMRERLEERALA